MIVIVASTILNAKQHGGCYLWTKFRAQIGLLTFKYDYNVSQIARREDPN